MLPKKAYKPNEEEKDILEFWLKNNFYSPEYKSDSNLSTANKGDRETYTNILPPPNANGNLHLGHMSGYAYQDLMGRYQRMKGKKVLLLPGKDHAGIQTEVVFEKHLEKKGKSKKDIGREKFYELCYDFCMKNSEIARSQEQKIGLSADFERELFTLDPRIVDEVLRAFTQMYEDGLIYRGKKLINWCVRCQSALADIDTEFKDSQSPFFYFKYAFTEPDKDLVALKNKYENKTVEWTYLQSENGIGEKTPFDIGEISNFEVNGSTLKVFALGNSDYKKGEVYKTKTIGVLSKLNGNHRLITISEDMSEEDIEKGLKDMFFFEISRAAGAHYILFDKYKEDKFYTKGFTLATVRPETKFGDTAIAVDPKDERYAEYVGKEYEVMTLNGPTKINIIADSAVDKEFGTGAVKITPAHAPEDWDIASRHPKETLPEKQVIDFDGKLNHLTGKYEGMKVKEARKAMTEEMKSIGMLIYLDEEYKNRIRICERCKHPIEPLISHQWFVDTKPLKEKAKQLVEDGITEIMPEGKKKTYIEWMNTPEDWCITRQLWWGYQLPVWYKGKREQYISETGEVMEKIDGKIMESMDDYKDRIYVGTDGQDKNEWTQDEDVLDTWFSSGQWPFVTLKAKEGDLEEFYSTQVMETGWDILLFWVTRMMLLNPYRAQKEGLEGDKNQTPFENVYLHGLVLDKKGIKMSKSKGNGIDPFEMMQKYGTDALRFSFVVGNSPGQNYRLYEEKIASYRNFCNKIWNASKFALMNLEDTFDKLPELKRENMAFTKEDTELLEHLDNLIEDTTRRMDNFQFGIAAQELYESFWHKYADVYIETVKNRLYTKDREGNPINTSDKEKKSRLAAQWSIYNALETYLKLLHPFIPFITERIWKEIPKRDGEAKTLMYSHWPNP